jgi:hypothetical protein
MQGAHRTRSSSSQVAIVVPVDAELRAILKARYGAVTRADLVAAVTRLVACTMATLRSEGAIPPALGETYTQVSPDPTPRPGQSSEILDGERGDPPHVRRPLHGEPTLTVQFMACGCPVDLHAPRRSIAVGATGGVCALGWPQSWRMP